MYYPDRMISFENIHKINNRAMPNAIMLYKTAIQLFKMYNTKEHSWEWIEMNFKQIITSRQMAFATLRANATKVGINQLSNRFHALNGQIPLTWLNGSLDSFKVNCKKKFLANG